MIYAKMKSSKEFMSKLLLTDLFHSYLLIEATIVTFNRFTLDGRRQRAFYSREEWETNTYMFSAWEEVKGILFQIVKGKNAPVSMKITLQLKPEEVEKVLKELPKESYQNYIQGLCCTIKYEKGVVSVTTGVAYQELLLDKEPERMWDKQMLLFLEQNQLEYE